VEGAPAIPMTTQIIPTAEPFLFLGGPEKPGVLLIHGFTGTPQSLRPMGEFLNREYGLTCLGIRLAGHATSPQDMAATTYSDWIASVEDGFALLSGLVRNIYLAGFSMGGSLALTMATRLPARAVIAMAAPFDLGRDWRLRFTAILRLLQPYIPKPTKASGWYDMQARQDYVAYPVNPVRSVIELGKLLELMRAGLPHVAQPVLLIHSKQDDYPRGDSMPLIYEKLGSLDKEALWIDGSGHVITLDAQRETVFRAAAAFINRLESASATDTPGSVESANQGSLTTPDVAG
jgi:carboxylesterase